MQEAIISYFSAFPKEWAVFLLSMVPVIELRGAIPLATLQFGMHPLAAFFYAVAGSTFLGTLVVVVVEPISQLAFKRVAFLNRFWLKYIERITRENSMSFEKWGAVALIIFIAIPLPLTGAFTGGVLASIFAIPLRKAFLMILAGCTIAGIIVTTITLGISGLV